MKLTSARILSKDFDDSLVLMKYLNIKSIDELYEIVQEYSNPNQQTAKSHFFIQEIYLKYIELENSNERTENKYDFNPSDNPNNDNPSDDFGDDL